MISEPKEGTNWYSRSGDKMAFGNTGLAALHYEFYDGVFSSIYFESHPNTEPDMIAALKAQFGDCFFKPTYQPICARMPVLSRKWRAISPA
jgi:hypothetical protein